MGFLHNFGTGNDIIVEVIDEPNFTQLYNTHSSTQYIRPLSSTNSHTSIATPQTFHYLTLKCIDEYHSFVTGNDIIVEVLEEPNFTQLYPTHSSTQYTRPLSSTKSHISIATPQTFHYLTLKCIDEYHSFVTGNDIIVEVLEEPNFTQLYPTHSSTQYTRPLSSTKSHISIATPQTFHYLTLKCIDEYHSFGTGNDIIVAVLEEPNFTQLYPTHSSTQYIRPLSSTKSHISIATPQTFHYLTLKCIDEYHSFGTGNDIIVAVLEEPNFTQLYPTPCSAHYIRPLSSTKSHVSIATPQTFHYLTLKCRDEYHSFGTGNDIIVAVLEEPNFTQLYPTPCSAHYIRPLSSTKSHVSIATPQTFHYLTLKCRDEYHSFGTGNDIIVAVLEEPNFTQLYPTPCSTQYIRPLSSTKSHVSIATPQTFHYLTLKCRDEYHRFGTGNDIIVAVLEEPNFTQLYPTPCSTQYIRPLSSTKSHISIAEHP